MESTGTMRRASCSSYPMQRYGSMRTDMMAAEAEAVPVSRGGGGGGGNDRLKKSNSLSPVEFPRSPQQVFGEEIMHFNHRQHPLSRINVPEIYTCSGCKEYGAGKRFSCRQCDFQLHDSCALAAPALKAYPLHIQHPLLLSTKPGGIMKPKCEVCGKRTKGYNFRCGSGCSYQIHPSCAMLSNHITISIHPHVLELVPSAAADTLFPGSACKECNRKRSGRIYRCDTCDYYLHAVCAKNMVNGLQADGRDKPSILSGAAKIATQVMKGFIGGLVEGIGEGVGQVFISTVVRGHPAPTTHH